MEKKLTKEQQLAIDIRDKEVMVSAGAGAGKTSVLVDRVIKLITSEDKKVNIDELLIVTFTSDASKVMIDRIYTALNKELAKNPNNEWILRQIFLLNRANISTIHGFCQKIIEKNINLLTIDPKFRVAGTEEVDLIKSEVFDEVIEEFYLEAEKGKNEFYGLVNCMVTKVTDQPFKTMFFDIYDKAFNNPFPIEYLDNSIKDYDIKSFDDLLSSEAFLAYKNMLFSIVEEKEALEKKYVEIFSGEDNTKLTEVCCYFKDASEYKDFYNKYEKVDSENYEKFFYDFLVLTYFENIKGRKAIADEYIKAEYDRFIGKRKNLKARVEDLEGDISFLKRDKKEILRVYKNMHSYMNEFKNFFESFNLRFKERKALNKVIDYSDMEHFAIEILINKEDDKINTTTACEYYQKKFKEVIVDEYQDCNDTQELIFQAITNGGQNMYMVGDVKQSIYKFRGAKPSIFISKLKNQKDSREVINLNKNFRSQKNILDFANQVFNFVMKEKSSSIDYDENHILELGKACDDEGSVNFLIGEPKAELDIDTLNEVGFKLNDMVDEEEFFRILEDYPSVLGSFRKETLYSDILKECEEKKLSFREAFLSITSQSIKDSFEGEIIGSKIKELMSTKGYEYKDFAILLRSKSNIKNITDGLKKQGIPYLADEKENIFSTYEVLSVTNFLKIIDNKFQDIPLVFVLKLPIYDFTEKELLKLKKYNQKYFFENLSEFYFEKTGTRYYEDLANSELTLGEKENEFSELLRKVILFFKDYNYFKNLYKKLSISDFIIHYLEKTNLSFYLQNFERASIKDGNLHILVEYAKDFEKTSFSSVFNFVKFIEKQENNKLSDVKGASSTTSVDKVNIMTIHGSKGLEFKVVFLAQLSKQFNKMDIRKRYLADNKFSFKYKDYEKKFVYEPLAFKQIKEDMNFELLAEELRVLYVAVTRAEEMLYLTYISKDFEKETEKFEELYESYKEEDFSKINSYSDILMPIAMKKFSERVALVSSLSTNTSTENDVIEDIKYNLDDYFFEYGKSYKEVIPLEVSVTKILSLEERKFFLNSDDEALAPSRKVLNFRKPEYYEEEYVIKGTEFGTLIHKIFWLLPFDKGYTKEELLEFINSCKDKNIITNLELECVRDNLDIIYSFVSSDIYEKILKADKVYKEKFFASIYDASLVYDDAIDEEFLLKGILDLMYIYEGDMYILDYKTDSNKETHFEKYQRQLNHYKRIIEKAYGKEVRGMYIYFTSFREFVEL